MDSQQARTGSGKALPASGTPPLKPKAGLNGPPAGHAYAAGGIAAGSSIYNPDPMNLGLNGMPLVPGALGEAAMPLTVVNDAGGLAGGVITNNVMARCSCRSLEIR